MEKIFDKKDVASIWKWYFGGDIEEVKNSKDPICKNNVRKAVISCSTYGHAIVYWNRCAALLSLSDENKTGELFAKINVDEEWSCTRYNETTIEVRHAGNDIWQFASIIKNKRIYI